MFHSDFDPPPRAHSVRGLIGIVAAVLLGIGFTVSSYLAEEGPTELRAMPGTSVTPSQPATGLQRAVELPQERIEPAQYRSRPQAAASTCRSTGTRSVQHDAQPPASRTSPACAPEPSTVAPAPTNQANAAAACPVHSGAVPPADA